MPPLSQQIAGARGSVMVEFTLVIPIMFLTILAVIDLSGWLNVHLYASRMAYEGVRYAASIPSLEYGDFEATLDKDGKVLTYNVTNPVPSTATRHISIVNRIRYVIQLENGTKKQVPQSVISGSYHNNCSNNPDESAGNRALRVSVQVPFDGGFFLKGKAVTATARGTYLFAPAVCVAG